MNGSVTRRQAQRYASECEPPYCIQRWCEMEMVCFLKRSNHEKHMHELPFISWFSSQRRKRKSAVPFLTMRLHVCSLCSAGRKRTHTRIHTHTHAHSSRESYYWQEATSKIEIRTTDSRFCLRPRGLLFSGACIQNACVRCCSGACIQAFQCVIASFLAKGRRWFSSGTAFDHWRA